MINDDKNETENGKNRSCRYMDILKHGVIHKPSYPLV